ncbi:MAG TPA: biotin/lipoyl-binding protein, partial [Roseateles sp.]|nr:biotin/lipoyl-binding protein [Roseateles sp.]
MMRHRLQALVVVSSLVVLLSACGKPGNGAAQAAKAPAAAKPLLLSPEDLQAMGLSSYASGPVITGSIQPEKRADLRAEVQAVVLQVFKENGEKVKRGELLVRLDDSAIRESLSSAEEAARAASQAFEQAE